MAVSYHPRLRLPAFILLDDKAGLREESGEQHSVSHAWCVPIVCHHSPCIIDQPQLSEGLDCSSHCTCRTIVGSSRARDAGRGACGKWGRIDSFITNPFVELYNHDESANKNYHLRMNSMYRIIYDLDQKSRNNHQAKHYD